MFFQSVFQELDGAYAPNTLTGYKKDLGRFCDRILMQNRDPKRISHTELIAYLETARESLKMATIKRAVAAISTLHKFAELPDPTKHPKVEVLLRRSHSPIIYWNKCSLSATPRPLSGYVTRHFFYSGMRQCVAAASRWANRSTTSDSRRRAK